MSEITTKPHQFAIKDEAMFRGGIVSGCPLLSFTCAVCGDRPGKGMHAPPPPKQHEVLIETVSRALAGTAIGRVLNARELKVPAAQLSFTALVSLRSMLAEMGRAETYSDPHDMGDPFGDIDTALDELLTELRRIGWNQEN